MGERILWHRSAGKALLSSMLAALAIVFLPHAARAADEVPAWFTETFLDLREDVRDAAAARKRVMLYFGQDGCPYCAELMRVNFTQARIVEKTRRNFLAIAINIWGDREVTWTDGKVRSEKDFARALKIQFTPTILMLDERGKVVARLNGYLPPHRFEPAIDYVAGHLEAKQPFDAYMRAAVRESASPSLADEPFLLRDLARLRRTPGSKPLVVLFETPYCTGCDEMHREAFHRPDVLRLLSRFDVARVEVGSSQPLTLPDGRRSNAADWTRALKVSYTPSVVFFDARGREVFRVEAYLRPFHFASALDYVASGAYREQPSFQRFVQSRAQSMRDRGERVELWQ